MKIKDMTKLLGMLSEMIDLKNEHHNKYDACQNEDEDCEDCEDDDEEDDELCKQLCEEYQAIMKWCFGKNFYQMTKEKSISKWKERHPKLPVPRSLMTSKLNPLFSALALLLDVIPMYTKEKNPS